MAEEENKETEEEEQPKEKKSSNMLMIMIIVVLILIIIIGGAVAFLLMSDNEEDIKQDKEVVKKEKKVTKRRSSSSSSPIDDSRPLSEIGTLYPLETFTVNLKSDSGRRYLKVSMSLEIDGEELSMELDAKSAVLRDRIIRILTSKTLEEISSKKGKAKVTQQIIDSLNSMMVDGSIKGLYFTEFVIQ
jgi:flagellar FliL protein